MAAIALAGAGQPDIDKGPSILAVCSTMTMIALVVVCSRLWVRVKMIGSVGIDVSFYIRDSPIPKNWTYDNITRTTLSRLQW